MSSSATTVAAALYRAMRHAYTLVLVVLLAYMAFRNLELLGVGALAFGAVFVARQLLWYALPADVVTANCVDDNAATARGYITHLSGAVARNMPAAVPTTAELASPTEN